MTLAQAYRKQFGKVSYPFEIYDSNGNETYFEDSNGTIRGSKQNQSCEGKVVEIDGKKYELKEL